MLMLSFRTIATTVQASICVCTAGAGWGGEITMSEEGAMFTFVWTRIPVSSRRRNPELATTRAADDGEIGTPCSRRAKGGPKCAL